MGARIETMTFAEYRAAPGVNLSRLKLLSESPRKYKVNPRKDTSSLSLGRAIHTAVLEPEKFEAEYAVWDKRKAGKEYTAFLAANPDKQVLKQYELDNVFSVAQAVEGHEQASEYFSEGVAELSVFWQHSLGTDCKSRIDWLRDDLLIDLKSARDVSPNAFSRSAANYDYFAQLAFYLDAAKAVDKRDRKVVILAVETSSPFDVVPYVVPEYALAAGRTRYTDWLLQLQRCQQEDHWPGVSEREIELHPPGWYMSELEDADLTMPDGTVVAA